MIDNSVVKALAVAALVHIIQWLQINVNKQVKKSVSSGVCIRTLTICLALDTHVVVKSQCWSYP